ncbi:T9SS type A sorting domain-containing protein [Bacteroides eggerthii]|uniref:T9SS type A sorting domain-containing protein n=1 Tax=Bacteroides eggerthii TaxID=28111 RepID=A0ABT7U4G5_9BACE|nr:T9SS type A sorting domain-containing protein [Bacteroides eggerthii]
MKVSAGTYNVTVSADGYETVQGQIVVDQSMCPEGSSEIIYKFSMENGFTGVQQADAVETLDIRNEGKQIVIDSGTDCRAQIYTLSGVCVTHLQGKNIRSEALAPGIYLVLARNAQGTISRKIIIGH